MPLVSGKILEFKTWSKEETEGNFIGAALVTQGQLRKLKTEESFINSKASTGGSIAMNGRSLLLGGRGNASKNGFITQIQCQKKNLNLNLNLLMLYLVAWAHNRDLMMRC
jgi:hypothetical protein